MSRPSSRAFTPRIPAVLLGLGLAVAAASGFSSTDGLIERGFATALPNEVLKSEGQASVPVAGTEEFWLGGSRLRTGIEAVTWNAPVAPGDRLRIRREGMDVTLEVMAVTEKAPAETRIAIGRTLPVYAVQCRDSNGAIMSIELGSDGAVHTVERGPAGRTL